MKYWWHLRRFLLFPIVNSQLSAILAILGLAVLVVAIWIAQVNSVGWFLAFFCCLGGATYVTDTSVRHFVRRHAPIFEKNIRPEDFTHAPHDLTPEYRFAAPSSSSESQLYPYVDLSHDSTHIRAENDLTRKERMELYQRWYRLCPKGFLHLEKLVGSEWRPIAVSIILPLSVEGFASLTHGDKNRQIQVIDLDRNDIRTTLDRRHPVLLIDTWIVDRAFGGIGHGKKADQGGFANALILRHIALFWNSVNRFRQVAFLVETDNKYLIPVLLMLAFRPSGYSKIGEVFYQVEKSTLQGLAPEEFKSLTAIIHGLESVPIEGETTARPAGWTKTFGTD